MDGVSSEPAVAAAAPTGAGPVPVREVAGLTEHLFRHEAGRLVSTLTRIFGPDRLALAEDVVQEALVRALQTWPYGGIPRNPAAWLTQTAKNLALDTVRRESRFREKQPAITIALEQWAPAAGRPADPVVDDALDDDRLRLMFVCCHPILPRDAQVALALKTLCGFSPAEIARAFLATESAITKRLTRARQRIRDAGVAFEIPTGADLAARLEAVLQTLYLLFNEGYKASGGEHLVRAELCAEAIRLAALLVRHPAGRHPQVNALLALMYLNAARFGERQDPTGNLIRLHEQDRSRWDAGLISQGLRHLAASAEGPTLTAYHLQAAIAACHCTAADAASTEWRQILQYYDRLVALDRSPIVALNRAVAVARVHGPRAALDALAPIRGRAELRDYHLLHALLGQFESDLGRNDAATGHWRRALQLTTVPSERDFLARRLQECGSHSGSAPAPA